MPPEVQKNRPSSEYIQSPIPRRSWNRHSQIGGHTIPQDNLPSTGNDEVSPISSPISAQISPSAPVRESQRFEYQNFPPEPQHIYTEHDFTKEEARAVDLASPDVVVRKPVAVMIRSRAATPVETPPQTGSRENQVHESTEQLGNMGNHVDIRAGWRRPSTIVLDKLSRWSEMIYGVVYFIIPILFLILAISLATLHGQPTEEQKRWGVYLNWMQIAGTLFPIFFALLVGRALVKVAGYLLERGTTLMNLEQLMGSRTVSGAFDTQMQLRSFNLLGLGLVVLFIFSPIGSQGFLRLLGPVNTSKTSPSIVPYFTTNTQSLFAQGDVIGSDAVQSSIFRSLYTAAVLAPSSIKNSPMDLWTNVKIPFQSSLVQVNGSDWVTITPNDTVHYSSLVGLPIGGLQNGETSLELESSYIELSCASPTRQPQLVQLTPFAHDSDTNSSPISPENGTYYGANPSTVSSTTNITSTWSLGLDRFISPMYNSTISIVSPPPKYCTPINSTTLETEQAYLTAPCALHSLSAEQVEPSTLLFQSTPVGSSSANQAFCQARTIYVQSKILCTLTLNKPPICLVTAQRHSQLPHAPELLTALSFPEIFQAISLGLPRAFHATGTNSHADPSLAYLANTETSSLIPSTSTSFSTTNLPSDLSGLPGDVLSRRLGQLINTYYTLSQSYPSISLGHTSSSAASSLSGPTALASVTITGEFWAVSWAWFAFLFLAILIMLFASVLGTVLQKKNFNPDVLGYVSSIIRDSKYVELEVRRARGEGKLVSQLNGGMRIKMGGLGEGEGSALVIGREGDVVQSGKGGKELV